jgi:hypothetical protein
MKASFRGAFCCPIAYRHVHVVMSALWAQQVADFGLSRHNPNKHTVATRTCGGVTHAAPELIREGRLSPATGVDSVIDEHKVEWGQLQNPSCSWPASSTASRLSRSIRHSYCACHKMLQAGATHLLSLNHPSIADVFAFGVLLAELLAGEPAWAALKSHAQVIAAVLSGKRPVVPASAPPELKVGPVQIRVNHAVAAATVHLKRQTVSMV